MNHHLINENPIHEHLVLKARLTSCVPSRWYVENLYGDYIFLCGATSLEEAQAYANRNWYGKQVKSSLIAHRRNHGD